MGVMLAVGIGAIAVNLVLPRFFCRWVCPYGALLRIFSMVSAWRVSVAPTTCINCHLCRDVCPVDAIVPPAPRPTPQEAASGLARVQWAVALLPLMVVVAVLAGLCVGHGFFRLHPDAMVLRQLERGEDTVETQAFAMATDTVDALRERSAVGHRFAMGVFALAFGVAAFLAGIEWIYRMRKKPEGEYTVERIDCICCGRCYGACPLKKGT